MHSKTRITTVVRNHLNEIHPALVRHLERVEAKMYADGDIFAKLSLRYHFALFMQAAKPKAWSTLTSEYPLSPSDLAHFNLCLKLCAMRKYGPLVLKDQYIALLLKYTMYDPRDHADDAESLIPYLGDFQADYWDYSLEKRTVKSQAYIE